MVDIMATRPTIGTHPRHITWVLTVTEIRTDPAVCTPITQHAWCGVLRHSIIFACQQGKLTSIFIIKPMLFQSGIWKSLVTIYCDVTTDAINSTIIIMISFLVNYSFVYFYKHLFRINRLLIPEEKKVFHHLCRNQYIHISVIETV